MHVILAIILLLVGLFIGAVFLVLLHVAVGPVLGIFACFAIL